MKPRTYTLKEAVSALNRSGTAEESSRLTRHIRHWTSMDLLETVGAKHTGTGKHREYSPDTVYRAAVLVELARWRVPMTVLADAFASFTDDAQYEWEDAIADDGEMIYLVMTWSEHGSQWVLQRDMPALHIVEEWYDEDSQEMEPVCDGEVVPASVIVVNMNRLLRWVKL